jgi:hypothetical protein
MPIARSDPQRYRVTRLTGLRINAYARARENGIREACPIRHTTDEHPDVYLTSMASDRI